MRTDLGQLAGGEVCRGLWGRGEATMNKCVQGDQGGQQLILTREETEEDLIKTVTHADMSTPKRAEMR